MNLAVLFPVWGHAGIWAHWNHSFDVHPDSPGLVSCSFPSGVPSAPLWVAAMTEAWRWAAPCLQQVFPQAHHGAGCSGLPTTASFVYWCGRQGIYFNYKKELDFFLNLTNIYFPVIWTHAQNLDIENLVSKDTPQSSRCPLFNIACTGQMWLFKFTTIKHSVTQSH